MVFDLDCIQMISFSLRSVYNVGSIVLGERVQSLIYCSLVVLRLVPVDYDIPAQNPYGKELLR